MDTKHLVDSELAPALALSPQFQFTAEVLPHIRAGLDEMIRQRQSAATTSKVVVEEHFVPGSAGAPDVRVLIFSPAKPQAGRAGYFHMHGGGYVMGSPEMFARQSEVLVGEIGCTVVSVDYRLAPDTPHPGPIEDCYAALTWFHTNAATLGVDPDRIAIGGDSAGGGLAAALGLLARDRNGPPICFQMLNYPMIDDRTAVTENPHPFAGEFVWNGEANRFGWQSLLGHAPGASEILPYAAAARAESLAGLPPTFIGVGGLDLFLEENLEFARRLLRAGVATELHVYPGAYHGFDMSSEDAAVSKQYRRDIREALKRGLSSK
jgi:acetyl esterase/lipase